MISLDDDVAMTYLAESSENLAAIEVDLLAIESGAATFPEGPLNRVFRAVHSIKGGASFSISRRSASSRARWRKSSPSFFAGRSRLRRTRSGCCFARLTN